MVFGVLFGYSRKNAPVLDKSGKPCYNKSARKQTGYYHKKAPLPSKKSLDNGGKPCYNNISTRAMMFALGAVR